MPEEAAFCYTPCEKKRLVTGSDYIWLAEFGSTKGRATFDWRRDGVVAEMAEREMFEELRELRPELVERERGRFGEGGRRWRRVSIKKGGPGRPPTGGDWRLVGGSYRGTCGEIVGFVGSKAGENFRGE